ncbi:unnamed protein product, partial [Ectocarpus sp. 12 AP-2014]
DTDGDGDPDNTDTDDDGDGISDAQEAIDGTDPLNDCSSIGGTPLPAGDCDGDGVPNAGDICDGFDDALDNDTDGVPDGCDQDDDNDGILDVDEQNCPTGFIGLGQVFNSTANPGVTNNIYAFGGAEASLSFRLINTTNTAPLIAWQSGVSSNGPTAGISGNYIEAQPNNTDFIGGDTAEYTLTFNQPVYNLQFKFGGLDNQDRANFSALNAGASVPVSISDINLGAFGIFNGQSVISSASGANSPSNSVQVTMNGAVTSVIIRAAKNNGNNSNVTLQLYELTYCLLIDTNNDDNPNNFDTDSDNDGCPDALEGNG